MRPASDAGSLRQRISAQLTRIIRAYVVLITAMLAAITLLSGYFFKVNALSHDRDLILTKLGTEVANTAYELQSLASSTLVWTGLTDSYGRDSYLEPLLSRFNRASLKKVMILDYSGRLFLAPDAPLVHGITDARVVRQAVNEGRDVYGMTELPGGATGFVLVQRVMSPQSESPVGFIVAVLDANALVRELQLGELSVSYALGGSELMPAPRRGVLLTDQVDTVVSPWEHNIAMSIWVGHSVLPSVAAGLLVVLLAFWLGLWTLKRVGLWAQGFSASTTARLEQLVDYSQKVLAGQPASVARSELHDEISQVVDTLGAMVRQQKAATDELRATSLVFSTAAEGILITDRRGLIVDVNPALVRMIGIERDALLGRQAGSLYRLPGQDSAPVDILRSLNREGRWSGETAFLDHAGQSIATSVSVSRIRGERGETLGHVAVITDISRLKQAEQQLRELAYQDRLTQLPNFRRMSELVTQRLARSQAPCALLFLDLDRLKFVNDTYGHDAGDRMICGMAAHLQRELPPGHLLCRRSGDEFIALIELEPALGEAALQALLKRLAHAKVALPAGPTEVTGTVGVARFPQDAQTWRELQVCADVAMNEAKRAQRGSVAWYDDRLGQKVIRQRMVQSRLVEALAQGAIGVHYQPVVDLASGQVLGFEALARWNDPELGVVRPSEFVAVADEAHLSDQLTMQVLRIILRDKPLIQQRFPGTVMAFNAAPRVFRHAALIDFLADQAELDPELVNHLEVELTETDIASSEGQLLRQLQMLTGLGVRLVIDDFGKGYSSLSRLAQYPISCLKIDASFVASLGLGRQTRIVELIVNLAQLLDIQVTAEGVETPAQRDMLLRMGCQRGQGWLYARALPLQAVLALLSPLPGVPAADAVPA